jgi:hypothetical protein
LAIFYAICPFLLSTNFPHNRNKTEKKIFLQQKNGCRSRGTCRFMRQLAYKERTFAYHTTHENFLGRKFCENYLNMSKQSPCLIFETKFLRNSFKLFKLTHCLKSAGAFCLKVVAREIGGTTAMLNKKYLLEGSVHTMRNKRGQPNGFC